MWQICVDNLCLNSSRTWDHRRPKKYRTFEGRSKTIAVRNHPLQTWVYSSHSGLTVSGDGREYIAGCGVTADGSAVRMEARVWDHDNGRNLISLPLAGGVHSIRDDVATRLEFYDFDARRRLVVVLPGKYQHVDREIKFLRGRIKITTAEQESYVATIRYINLCPPYRRMCKQADRQSA
jgi:hypothetical protein